jgi:hypothetical protein
MRVGYDNRRFDLGIAAVQQEGKPLLKKRTQIIFSLGAILLSIGSFVWLALVK